MIDTIKIMLIGFLSLVSLAAVVILPTLIVLFGTPVLLTLFGSAIATIIQLCAPALITLALGFGIGFGTATMQKKEPTNPMEGNVETVKRARFRPSNG